MATTAKFYEQGMWKYLLIFSLLYQRVISPKAEAHKIQNAIGDFCAHHDFTIKRDSSLYARKAFWARATRALVRGE